MSDEKDTPSTWGSEAKGLANRLALGSGVAVTFLLFGLIVVPALLRERRPLARPPSDQPAAASVGWLDQAEAPASKGRDLPPVDPATVMTPNPKLLAAARCCSSRTAARAMARADRAMARPRERSIPDRAISPSPLTGSAAFT
jgi:hypothetical protein